MTSFKMMTFVLMTSTLMTLTTAQVHYKSPQNWIFRSRNTSISDELKLKQVVGQDPQYSLENPCKYSLGYQDSFFQTKVLKEEVYYTMIELRRLETAIENGLDDIEHEKLVLKRDREILSFFYMPGLPTISRKINKVTTSKIQQDHLDLQKMSDFSEFLYNNEQGNDRLKDSLYVIRYYLNNCLCRLDTILRVKASPPKRILTTSVVPYNVKQYVMDEDKYGWTVTYVALIQEKRKVQSLATEYGQLYSTLSYQSTAGTLKPTFGLLITASLLPLMFRGGVEFDF